MKRIGLLSDTHSWWDERYKKYFDQCDEIWHAGDIGSMELAEKFEAFKLYVLLIPSFYDSKWKASMY